MCRSMCGLEQRPSPPPDSVLGQDSLLEHCIYSLVWWSLSPMEWSRSRELAVGSPLFNVLTYVLGISATFLVLERDTEPLYDQKG